MSDVEFAVLGSLEVRRGGAVLDLGGPKQRAVLAFLLTHPGEPVSLDRLIDELWGDDAPPKATASLQAYVSNLRRVLEPDRAPRAPARILVSRPPGYALDLRSDALDAVRFEQEAEGARRALAAGDAAAALDHAERALAEWRGDVLADFPYDDFAEAERARLADRRVALEQDRAAALLELDRAAEAADVAEALAAAHPLREQVWELLMLSRYRSGRQAEALRAFQDARRVLGEELGLEPGPALRRLEEQILDQDPTLDLDPAGPTAERPAPARVPAPVAAPSAPEGPLLVGRSDELERLQLVLASAGSGRAAFALVSGEAGIGKTTLVRAAAERSGAQVVWGRSQEQASDGALWPWRQVVHGIVPAGVTDPALELLTSGPGTDLGTPVDRLQLYDAVARLLASRTIEPVVVVLEDIHWADADSLRLLDYLATELQDGSVAVLATFRPDEVGEPVVASTLGSLARRPDLVRVELTGLGPEHVRSFAREVGDLELDPAAADALHGRTAGNPFFLTELVRLLSAERGRHDGVAAATVPASVRDVVRRRVERLPDDSRTVLSVAAVAGAAVGIDVLAEACGVRADAALDALEPPFLIGLVEEAGPAGEQVRFAHALVAETLATDLPATRRRRLHGRIADAIETVHGADLDEHLASLAHHHGQAAAIGHAASATRFAVLAARQAARRGAVFESARLWEEAEASAELDPAATPADRLALTLEAALALGRSGDLGTRAKVVEAIDRAEALGDATSMAQAARALMAHATSWTWTDMRTNHADVTARLERTLARLGEGDSPERARVLGILALGVYTDERRRSLDLAEEGVAMAARLGDEELRGECMATRIVVLNDLDQHELRRAIADELIEIGERVGRTKLSLAGLVSRIDAGLIVGDLDGAAADAARVEAALAREPDPPVQMQLAYYLPRRLLIEGRFDEAEAANERAYELRRAASLWWGGEESMFSVLFDIRREQGRLDEMLPWFGMGIGDDRVLIPNLHAQVLVETGRHDEARAVLGPAGIQRPVEDWYWIAEAVTAAELACELGDLELAAELREQLRPFSGLLSCNGSITTGPPVDLHLGRLDRLLGDGAAARDHLRAALDLAVRIAAPSFEAQCALRLGLLLREDGDPEAGEHLARAAALAEAHDLRRVARLLN